MKNLILKRTEAAAYLSSRGLRASKITLARMAMDGSGPPYALIRGAAYYTPNSLDDWLEKNIELRPHSLAHMMAEKGGSNV